MLRWLLQSAHWFELVDRHKIVQPPAACPSCLPACLRACCRPAPNPAVRKARACSVHASTYHLVRMFLNSRTALSAFEAKVLRELTVLALSTRGGAVHVQ